MRMGNVKDGLGSVFSVGTPPPLVIVLMKVVKKRLIILQIKDAVQIAKTKIIGAVRVLKQTYFGNLDFIGTDDCRRILIVVDPTALLLYENSAIGKIKGVIGRGLHKGCIEELVILANIPVFHSPSER